MSLKIHLSFDCGFCARLKRSSSANNHIKLELHWFCLLKIIETAVAAGCGFKTIFFFEKVSITLFGKRNFLKCHQFTVGTHQTF
jgi:hypothetical protein